MVAHDRSELARTIRLHVAALEHREELLLADFEERITLTLVELL
ncbi:MAG: hypothetical protein WBE83_04850 [Candidatus Cybelea sp.]